MLAELRTLLRLGLPVVAGQIGMMLLHSVDTLMLGKYGVEELAAASLGSQWMFLTLTIGMGFVQGIDPLVAQRHGAQNHLGTGHALQQGLVMALVATLFISVSLLFTEDLLLLVGQEPRLSRMAARYVVLQLPSVFPFLGWVAIRSYLQGREIVRPAMWVMLPVNLLNALFNWLLIFGPGPFPEWGLEGAAIATNLSRFFTGGLLLAWVLIGRLHEGAWEKPQWLARLRFAELRAPLLFGIQGGLQFGLEVSAFATTAFVAGQLGAAGLAAHAIVLSFAALMFMLPLGIAVGTTTRVGNLIGAGRSEQLPKAISAAAAFGAIAISINVSILLLGRHAISNAYTEDAIVRAMAAGAFLVAAAFQVSDCVQVVIAGALRGMGRTRAPAVATFVGYYIFGIPCGYYWGIVQGHGLAGLWWGLALGLTIVAVALSFWLLRVLRLPLPQLSPAH